MRTAWMLRKDGATPGGKPGTSAELSESLATRVDYRTEPVRSADAELAETIAAEHAQRLLRGRGPFRRAGDALPGAEEPLAELRSGGEIVDLARGGRGAVADDDQAPHVVVHAPDRGRHHHQAPGARRHRSEER